MHAEPVAAAAVIKRVLADCGAAVTHVHRLGNQALVFTFELTAGEVTLLRDGLAAVSQLLDPSEETLEQALRTFPANAELVCSLHVTLVHGAPDERVPLPKVPG